MSYLLVSNENPVDLDGYIDNSSNLQIKHDSDNLVDHDQEIWCSHDTNYSITVKIYDFVHSNISWTVYAEHDSTSWRRASDHVWFTFTEEPSLPFDVEVQATASGQSNKYRTIKIKPQPQQPPLLLQPPAEQVL